MGTEGMGVCNSCQQDPSADGGSGGSGGSKHEKSKKKKFVDDGHGNFVPAGPDGKPLKQASGTSCDSNAAGKSKFTPAGKERQGGVFATAQAGNYVTGKDTIMGYESTKKWAEKKLGEKLDDDLWEWAHDGHRLCKLANALKPNSIDMGKLNKSKTIAMHCTGNIDKATAVFKTLLGSKNAARNFRSPDLYDRGSSYPKQIWICLSALEKEYP